MQDSELDQMPLEQLWCLHEAVGVELNRNLALEKAKLEERLLKISASSGMGDHSLSRSDAHIQKYFPSIGIQKKPEKAWAGRGKQPRWLRAQLRSGKKLDQFAIRGIS